MPPNVTRCIWICFAIALFVAFAPLPSAAQSGFSAADNAVFKAYVLDAGKVNRFITGLSALAMAKQMDDAIAEDFERMDNEDGDSLAELKARLTRHPRIFGFFQRQNLTPDDAILIPLVITFAGVAIAAPGQMADAVSPAQVNFVRSNAALVQRLGEANEALENSN
jgi:hypothetical protein